MNRFIREAVVTLGALEHPMARRFATRLAPLTEVELASDFTGAAALRHLGAAIESVQAHPLARAAGEIVEDLRWTEVDPGLVPPDLVGAHAFCEIVGPDGHAPADDYRLGFFISGPGIHYPAHSHEAEEIFFVLSGTAQWLQSDGVYQPYPPGTLIHHEPRQRHATRTEDEPLLVIWAWDGDIGFDSYQFHSDKA